MLNLKCPALKAGFIKNLVQNKLERFVNQVAHSYKVELAIKMTF